MKLAGPPSKGQENAKKVREEAGERLLSSGQDRCWAKSFSIRFLKCSCICRFVWYWGVGELFLYVLFPFLFFFIVSNQLLLSPFHLIVAIRLSTFLRFTLNLVDFWILMAFEFFLVSSSLLTIQCHQYQARWWLFGRLLVTLEGGLIQVVPRGSTPRRLSVPWPSSVWIAISNKNWNGNNRRGYKFDNRQQHPVTTLLVETETGPQEYALVDQDTYESYYQQTCLPVDFQKYNEQSDMNSSTSSCETLSTFSPMEEGKASGDLIISIL